MKQYLKSMMPSRMTLATGAILIAAITIPAPTVVAAGLMVLGGIGTYFSYRDYQNTRSVPKSESVSFVNQVSQIDLNSIDEESDKGSEFSLSESIDQNEQVNKFEPPVPLDYLESTFEDQPEEGEIPPLYTPSKAMLKAALKINHEQAVREKGKFTPYATYNGPHPFKKDV